MIFTSKSNKLKMKKKFFFHNDFCFDSDEIKG